MKQKRIYVSSQNFGYGPTSNLFAILKSLKTKTDLFEIHAIENESLQLFSSKEPDIIDSIAENIEPKKTDLVLSSFDPFIILDAWLNDIPTVFYCNLFWYWDIYTKKEKLISTKNQLQKFKNEKNFSEAKNLFMEIFNENPHLGIFMGFFLANHSFTRRFPTIEKFHAIFKNEINLSVFDIYIPYELQSHNTNKPNILIQLAGGRNCIVTDEENILYLELCLALAKYLALIHQELNFIICVNPKILDLINLSKNLANNIQVVPSLSQHENLEMMEKSLAIFSSPGLETIYESIYTQCPIFLLPEQNAGQFSIFQLLQSTGYNPDRYLVNEIFPERNKFSGEEDAHAIYKLLKENLLDTSSYQHSFFEKASAFIKKVKQPAKRKEYIDMSWKSLKGTSLNDPFTTNEVVSDFIIERYG